MIGWLFSIFFYFSSAGLTHDVPQMAVLSKVIQGDLHIREFDVRSSSGRRGGDNGCEKIAELVGDCIKTSADRPWFLGSKSNNIHEFTAISNTAVFDVLLPPYDAPTRPCNYYRYYN